MTDYISDWVKSQLLLLQTKTADYSEKEEKSISLDYLKKVVTAVSQKSEDDHDFETFKARVEKLFSLIPLKVIEQPLSNGLFHNELKGFKEYVSKNYNLVSKDHGKTIWLSLGLTIGISFGVVFKNIGLGIALGIALGVAYGTYLDQKAEKENRVL